MRIGIVIPSFQQGRFIEATLQSVLIQNVDKEVFVQDGGSSDETLSILKKYSNQISWVSSPDDGQTQAINCGLKKTSAEILCYLNSDDVFKSDALQTVLSIFESYPDIDVVYGKADVIDPNGNYLSDYPTESYSYERLLETCIICQPACFFRRSVYEKFGSFNEALNLSMDYEYWLRIGKASRFFYLERKLAESRYHPDAKTLKNRFPIHEEILSMLEWYSTPPPLSWIRGYLRTYAEQEMKENNFFCFSKAYFQKFFEIQKRYYLPLKAKLWLATKCAPSYRAAVKQSSIEKSLQIKA